MADPPLTAEVRAFFDKYNEAFASLDGKVIAACYHATSQMPSGPGEGRAFASAA